MSDECVVVVWTPPGQAPITAVFGPASSADAQWFARRMKRGHGHTGEQKADQGFYTPSDWKLSVSRLVPKKIKRPL